MAPHTLSSHLLADYSLLHCPSAAVVAIHDHRHHLRRHRATSATSTRLVRGAEVSATRGDEEPVGEDGPPTNGGFFAPPPHLSFPAMAPSPPWSACPRRRRRPPSAAREGGSGSGAARCLCHRLRSVAAADPASSGGRRKRRRRMTGGVHWLIESEMCRGCWNRR